jgi:hypothetical protein
MVPPTVVHVESRRLSNEAAPMEFILTVILYYTEPDRPPKVQRSQLRSYVECNQARVEAISKTPPGVQSVNANCVSGHLPKTWVDR